MAIKLTKEWVVNNFSKLYFELKLAIGISNLTTIRFVAIWVGVNLIGVKIGTTFY